MKMKIEINDAVAEQLQELVGQHQKHGAPNQWDTLEGLVNYVLSAVADGARRPGSWERQLLEMMGLVPNSGGTP